MDVLRCALVATAVTAVTAATIFAARPAAAAEPYACPADGDTVCVYEGADGTGASFAARFQWAGGFKLTPSGWDNRASSVANPTDWTIWVYSLDEANDCVVYRDVLAPGEKRAVVAGARKNFDLLANMEYTEMC